MAEKHNKNTQEQDYELVRLLGKDIRGSKRLFAGLTLVKGVNWAIANAICKITGISKTAKIGDLTQEEMKQIEDFMAKPSFPLFLKNRRNDFDTGEDSHLYGADLNLKKEFDIKRLKKIRSYKGLRHTVGLPVRGQRTKSNFRPNRRKSGAVGSKK